MTRQLTRVGGPGAAPLPILEYHGIHVASGSPGVYNPRYSVTPEQFAGQLDWLSGHGFRTTLMGGIGRKPRDVVLTFDDGDVSAIDVAMPLLVERGMVGEFCITTDHVGQPGRVSPQQVRQLAENEMGVASHGRTHRQLSTLSTGELAEELTESKRRLEEWSGRRVTGLSLPGGRGGTRELQAARHAGYEWVFNSFPGPNRRRWDGYLHRLVVTSSTNLEQFAQLVQWRGAVPWQQTLRTAALEVPKRTLGDGRYTRLRALVSFGRGATR